MKEKAAQLAAEVAELLRQAQAADDEEDRRYGKDKRGDELPQELAFRERRLEKIREAMAALEAEAQAAAEQAEAEGGKHPGVPDDKAQRNFTDAKSRIIPAPGGKDFLQAYNCQAVVDSAHQVIVAARATNQTSDKQQAAAMMEETIDNVGAVPREVSADAGYYSAKAVDELRALGVDPFVAPEQTRHGRVVPPAPRGRIPGHLSPRDRMRRKLQTKRGRQRYALRMQTVEPVFGQIKQGRGFRQFLLRGLEKVNGEWSLICTGRYPESKGLRLQEGTIVDASIIAAPSSTKNRAKERDPEMHQTKKGNEWHFGMKVHIGVDSQTGVVHSMTTTSANVHDLTELPRLLHGGESQVWGDAGYQGVDKRPGNRGLDVEWQVAMRPGQRRKLEPESPEAVSEKRKASVRAKVEHPFLYIKRHFGYAKVRYRGLSKNTQRLMTLLGFANLMRAEQYLAA